jgi:uncharacterized protein YkwD
MLLHSSALADTVIGEPYVYPDGEAMTDDLEVLEPDVSLDDRDNLDDAIDSGKRSVARAISRRVKRKLLRLVNEARAVGHQCGSEYFGPADPVTWHRRLKRAAQRHSNDMATNDFFDHMGSHGSQPSHRVSAAGYAWSTVGENIAAGFSSARAVITGWLDSPGHCANIMNPNFTQMGVARAINRDAEYETYWTQVFAAPRR